MNELLGKGAVELATHLAPALTPVQSRVAVHA
jgi:hypothetical protein